MEKLEIKKLLVRNFCPICGGKYNIRDNIKTINPIAFEILNLKECINCNHWWVDPLPIQNYLKELYDESSSYIQKLNFDKNELINKKILIYIIKMIRKINDKAKEIKILEYGFSKEYLLNCFNIKYLTGNKIEIINIKPEEIFNFYQSDSFNKFSISNKFDLIIIKDFIERFEDPIRIFKLLGKIARKDAIILCKLPNKDSLIAKLLLGSWSSIKPLHNLHYFSSKSIEILFKKSDIKLIKKYNFDLNTSSSYLSDLKIKEKTNYKNNIIRSINKKIKLLVKRALYEREMWIVLGRYF